MAGVIGAPARGANLKTGAPPPCCGGPDRERPPPTLSRLGSQRLTSCNFCRKFCRWLTREFQQFLPARSLDWSVDHHQAIRQHLSERGHRPPARMRRGPNGPALFPIGSLPLSAVRASRPPPPSSRRPRKVSGTKMLWNTKEFGRDYKKPAFPSSSPLTPATESVSPAHLSLWEPQQVHTAYSRGSPETCRACPRPS
jgi:hypothetical protein